MNFKKSQDFSNSFESKRKENSNFNEIGSYKKLQENPGYGSVSPYGFRPEVAGYPGGTSQIQGGAYQIQPSSSYPVVHQGGAPYPVPTQGQLPPPPSYSSVTNASSHPAPGNVPDDDDDDDESVEGSMPKPSAPPPQMDPVAGYEGVSFTAGDFLAPPTAFTSLAPSAPPTQRPEFMSGPTWTDEEVREALLEFVSQFCCYGKGTAQNLVITEKIGSNASHYCLETFAESRQVNWTFTPYTLGTFVDGPENGRAPGPWEIPVQITEYFKDYTHKLEIPHTSYVRPCHTCGSTGSVICDSCHGRGKKRCSMCHGSGRRTVGRDRRSCSSCHGSGRKRCNRCCGTGYNTCESCEGTCHLRLYLELTVQWKNHVNNHIHKENLLPSELILNVQGTTAFQETHLKVWPINDYFVPDINRASNELVNKHATSFPMEQILQQRQTIRIVPVSEVNYKWKDVQSYFFVYGLEKKVYAPEYPQTCCCGCTIL